MKPNATLTGGRDGLVPFRARRCQPRVENSADAELPDDVRGATDVVALRVRENERRQRANAHARQLSGDVCLGRALVDEHAGARSLE